MANDIVERLRALAALIDPCLLGGPDARLMNEAADRIASLEAELKAAREEAERWAAVANREDEARQMWQADNARLREAAKLALQRLGELNRDDEAGVRMVLANAIDAALSQPPVGERGCSDAAILHLGNVLSMLAELHSDDRCEALESALVFYNQACPNAQVVADPAYEIRLVITGPLDRAIAALPASPGREG